VDDKAELDVAARPRPSVEVRSCSYFLSPAHGLSPSRATGEWGVASAPLCCGCILGIIFGIVTDRKRPHKDGHGLGLSIVRAIATVHQASISARPRPDGGLTVSVIFPQPVATSVTRIPSLTAS
jgi:hypothetical protein